MKLLTCHFPRIHSYKRQVVQVVGFLGGISEVQIIVSSEIKLQQCLSTQEELKYLNDCLRRL